MKNSETDEIFTGNFLLFTALLVVCSIVLCLALVSADTSIAETDAQVAHTRSVISEAEQFSALVESILSVQRGYLITGKQEFLDKYEAKKAVISESIARLSELTDDNPSQRSRLEEIRNYFSTFSQRLDERANMFTLEVPDKLLDNVEEIDGVKDNIVRINSGILQEEYSLLNSRIIDVENKKRDYLFSLLTGIVCGTIILMILNGFLFHAHRKRARIEASLKDSEERFSLAIDGTQDGIFDWDIKNDTIFYSRRFFEMLGYEIERFSSSTSEWMDLIHPDDRERVQEYIDKYLKQEISEYFQEFRMKHNSGRWVWIQSRAKTLFDKYGKPYRMVGAHMDITHVILQQEKMKAEMNEAQESNRAKSDFLAHMSHEIRTPLTAISGIAEILTRNQKNLDDKQRQLVDTLTSSTSSLKDLVNDILDFSKIESGDLELGKHHFLLDTLFESVVSMMSLRASEKGISFVFDYSTIKGLEFFGDEVRLRQIIVNLLGNALKFTDKGGVSVKVYKEIKENIEVLCIDVTDTGIGISSENFGLIFERFKQADSSVSRKYGGTGLGLPISKNLAQLMGGDIYVSSQPGKGSTFSVWLPIVENTQTGQQTAEDQATNFKIGEKLHSAIQNETKVLIVEDYDGNIVVIGYILDEIGLSYDVAKTGLDAVNLWKKNHYDLILMDVQMPEMDGFQATREIRAIEKIQKIDPTPIIGMTAHALVGDRDKCIEVGMTSYLPKPIVESDFKLEIFKNLSSKKVTA